MSPRDPADRPRGQDGFRDPPRPGANTAPSRAELEQGLTEAFEDWVLNHGGVWWDVDTRLAQAIADLLGIKLEWDAEETKVIRADA